MYMLKRIYDLKCPLTFRRVFIMAFTALTGSLSHFAIGGAPEWIPLIICVMSTLLWAQIGARIANRARPITLNRITGGILIVLAVVILFVNIVWK